MRLVYSFTITYILPITKILLSEESSLPRQTSLGKRYLLYEQLSMVYKRTLHGCHEVIEGTKVLKLSYFTPNMKYQA
jgi:hypothetical protein